MRWLLAWLVVIAEVASGCGPDERAWLALRVHAGAPDGPGGTRRFPPYGEPDRVRLQVFRSDDVLGSPVAKLDRAWDQLEESDSGSKYVLVTVASNRDREHAYILRLSSLVGDAVDECGAVGQIRAAPGEKVLLDLHTHQGDCMQTLCQNDDDCIGERYCLDFECHPGTACGSCPSGAYCDTVSGQCAGACGSGATLCTFDHICCGEVCALSCPL